MTDCLYVMSVRVNNKCSIVLSTVLWSQAGRAIALSASSDRRRIERVYLLSVFSRESNMQMRWLFLCLVEAQRCIAVRITQLNAIRWPVDYEGDTQWF